MVDWKQRILAIVHEAPGLTDRAIADALMGRGKPQQPINAVTRSLAANRLTRRTRRPDGLLGNYPAGKADPEEAVSLSTDTVPDSLGEDEIKRHLQVWLGTLGWNSTIAWGKSHGVDIDARRGTERWLIEVKGRGSRSAMRVNYFLAVLGEILQRMDDPAALYSIAIPDLSQYRGLWERLPALARSKSTITALFVSGTGVVTQKK